MQKGRHLMNMQRCENGHYYDKSKFAQCPYCNPAYGEVNRTVPLEQSSGSFDEGFGGFNGGFGGSEGADDIGVTVPLQTASEVTVAIMPETESGKRYDPVVGWFVCVEGPDKGVDFRIRGGNNSIGRGGTAQIRILGDSSISKENMALVAYDARTRKFFFAAGDGRNLIYINEELLLPHQSRELRAYDRILLGHSTLLFLPLCGGEFSWE